MKARHTPLRTCIVCRETSDKRVLLRVVRTSGEEPAVLYDGTGKANGRGAYVCAQVECIDKALKQKRFERSLNVSILPEGLAEQLRSAVTGD